MKRWIPPLIASIITPLFAVGIFLSMRTDFQVVRSIKLADYAKVAVGQKRAWFCDDGKLYCLELSHANNAPHAIDQFEAPKYTHCVAIHADRLFLSRQGLIQVYQTRDVQKPEFVSSFRPPGNSPSIFALRSGLLAMNGYGGGTDSQQIHVYDVSNIAQPMLLSTVVTARGANIHNITMTDSLILVSNGWDGLTIIGKDDDQDYAIVSKIKLAGYVRGAVAEGNRAYVASSTAPGYRSEFAIVDISDPASPKKIASVETSGGAQDVYVHEQVAFVADRGGGLLAVDISDEAQPEIIDRYSRPGTRFTNISGSNDLLVLTRTGGNQDETLEVLTFNKP